MTVIDEAPDRAVRRGAGADLSHDHRGSWLPTGRMIAGRLHELRRRRGLMLMVVAVTVGIPTVYLAIRLILHVAAPNTYGPAGGFDTYLNIVAGVLYLFGFIVAATLGASAGSTDLTEGMFRHHVITGRSRMALYLARIPAGFAIIGSMVAVGFAIVCAVCSFAAPTTLRYAGVAVPVQLSEPAFDQWAAAHASEVINNFPIAFSAHQQPVAPGCLPGPGGPGPGGGIVVKGDRAVPSAGGCTPPQQQAQATQIAVQDYADYHRIFLAPPVSLMVKTGLWIELEAAIGFLVGLGLASLIGQRTVATVLLIILEVVVTPIAARAHLPHMINLQRAVVGIATAHLEPGHLPSPLGGGPQEQALLLHETTGTAIIVIVAWVVVWTALGAWRMMTRDV